MRKSLLDYDDVLRQQRETMYDQRNIVLENEDVHAIVKEMFQRVAVNKVAAYTDTSTKMDTIDEEGLADSLHKMGLLDIEISASDFENRSVAETGLEPATQRL